MTCRHIIQSVSRASSRASLIPRHTHQAALHSSRRPAPCLPNNHQSWLSPAPSSFFSTESSSPTRRRRRRTAASPPIDDTSSLDDASSSSPILHSSNEPFTPLSTTTGLPLTSTEYLSLASLSPWVPCPDIVTKRVFEIASATSNDTHVDLGCGDGRLNFAALSSPHFVKRSVGVDVDENVLERARERLRRRFVPTRCSGVSGGNDGVKKENELDSSLEFLQGDLIQVIQSQKERYQQGLLSSDASATVDSTLTETESSNTRINEIHTKIASSTLITMYFVHSSLSQLKPYLASVFGGKDNVRIVTIGYEMPDWEPDWAERVLDLTVFRYDMKGVSCHPVEWSLSYDSDAAVDYPDDSDNRNSGHSNGIENLDELQIQHQIILQNKQKEMDLLNNSNLRIHHDEELDAFASFRTKRMALHHSTLESMEEWEKDWDFDEEECGADDGGGATMKRNGRDDGGMKRRGEGKSSLLAGLDTIEMDYNGKKMEKKMDRDKPVWRKPE